jgi:hypothetical protein
MKSHQALITAVCLAGAAAPMFLTSCATSKYVAIDHRAYEKTPDNAATLFWRDVARSNAWSREAAFHGNWGGSGNRGGALEGRRRRASRINNPPNSVATRRSVTRAVVLEVKPDLRPWI